MPQIFKETYRLARCIIDCTEIFIEQPVAYQARAKTYSNYKKHNAVQVFNSYKSFRVHLFCVYCMGWSGHWQSDHSEEWISRFQYNQVILS